MKKTTQITKRPNECALLPPVGGLPVRTNLRAGLAWDDLDDQASALWSKLTSTRRHK